MNKRLERLRRGLRGRADVRATSARWAWVEAVLAAGGEAEGHAVLQAVHAGGSFRTTSARSRRSPAPEPPRRQSLPLLVAG